MSSTEKPLILMYHGIVKDRSDIPPNREVGAEIYDVTLDNFQEQMNYLQSQGYSVGPLGMESEKRIILTFDDGELNNFDHVFNVLQKLKFSAYFFVTVNRVGELGYMNWEHLYELRDAGMKIGSHGLNHVILTEQKKESIEQEIFDSKDVLEQHLKLNMEDLSISRGFYNDEILRLANEAGYQNVFVSKVNNSADNVFGRVAVKGNWSLNRFKQSIEGQVPVDEKVAESGKNIMKSVLGNKGYDKLRSFILRGKK